MDSAARSRPQLNGCPPGHGGRRSIPGAAVRDMLLTRRQQWELALVVALAVLVAAAAVAAGRFSLVSGKRADVLYDQTYDQMQGRVTLEHRIEGDWQ